MLTCFICRVKIVSLKLLQHHIRKHDLLAYSVFKCCQNDCERMFNTSKSIIQHIRKFHSDHESSSDKNEAVSYDLGILQSVSDCDQSESIEETEACNNNEASDINLDSFDVKDLSFILSFYANANFNRTNVKEIINNTILWADQKNYCNHSFQALDTEYKVQKALVVENLWIEPKTFVMDYNESVFKRGSTQYLKMQPFTCCLIPLKSTLEKVFSIPYILELAEKYMSKKNTTMKDVKDAHLCNNLPKNCFPFVIFFDELETGNPLSSHRGKKKIGVFYFALRCFPPYLYGKLSNIFLYAVVPSNAVDYRYMGQLLTKLAKEISQLFATGIEINGKRYTFKFIGLTGDNLGQHQLLGFSGSFSANYYCRVCRSEKNDCRSSCKEDHTMLRNRLNYAEDINVNDASTTGIKFACPLNSIPHYHVTENIIFDIMHDVLEGVANFGLCAIIKKLTEDGTLSLQSINERVHMFPFMNNRPRGISEKRLNNGDLAFSASEMMNLTLYFSLIVGDMVPSS